jgi:hypothetical protein
VNAIEGKTKPVIVYAIKFIGWPSAVCWLIDFASGISSWTAAIID